jgi:hypothetical protein
MAVRKPLELSKVKLRRAFESRWAQTQKNHSEDQTLENVTGTELKGLSLY